jgi:hypothetical protein
MNILRTASPSASRTLQRAKSRDAGGLFSIPKLPFETASLAEEFVERNLDPNAKITEGSTLPTEQSTSIAEM